MFSLRNLIIVLSVLAVLAAATLGFLFWQQLMPAAQKLEGDSVGLSEQEKRALLDQFSNEESALSVEGKSQILAESAATSSTLSNEEKVRVLEQQS